MVELTLARQHNRLAAAAEQRRILESCEGVASFSQALDGQGIAALSACGIETLQINLGKVCNQTCRHCHVDAGPDRRESMSRETAEACIDLLRRAGIPTLDITGGAPEMNPNFRWLATEARRLGRRVIDRCNLTILVAPGFEDLPEFLADRQVEVVASLPCYLQENVDRQRGDRAFQRSIEALHRLNELGYGLPGSSLTLALVYNPLGPSLPPPQHKLEVDYRRELRKRHGVEFTRLYTITNMPISRFLVDLLRQQKLEEYLEKLVEAFNPTTVEGLMCRTTLSVDWLGNLYDCDFNQMLELGLAPDQPRNLRDLDDAALARLVQRRIATGRHCFGCTAGAGSSCAGQIQG
ncbi:MAG TPA: arsenosugar biosynthesis radical SAM (seleno)protein ArsS [Pirellulales bacterium]|nr:arsenosugar biosynthesis radical SAM (seleno)protein ArsS [Pirellulales bacterium]